MIFKRGIVMRVSSRMLSSFSYALSTIASFSSSSSFSSIHFFLSSFISHPSSYILGRSFHPVDLLSRRSVIPPLYSGRARVTQWRTARIGRYVRVVCVYMYI